MFTDSSANIRQSLAIYIYLYIAIYVAMAKKCLALLYFRIPFFTDNSGADFHAD